ncbi:SoxR reducing system RseC family protein [Treponema endosymbiont of Eucomonympha sp.]|uniref:SoxR reducing system RseC family protein n=1 Tax=Treponema endosymbiont of Eucomonympha sp. TaxID=1580831 RepID=UPI00075151D7|nr:SoxR reducing system RseC family protein [Treponema endosymbiont of Eucomonympha sp.]
MRDKAVVSAVDNDEVWVLPMLGDACAGCGQAGCAKRGASFRVANSARHPVQRGDVVVIAASARTKTAQGLFALLFPVASAVLGYAVATSLLRLAGRTAGEGAKALSVLVGTALAVCVVLLASKRMPARAEITEICDNAHSQSVSGS